jgi:murein DD-endopeptidase MepM/ murein hydrolase activator NlpD
MTNPAILIAGEVGMEVKSAAKGIVTSISEEPRTGNTITMDIGSDFKLVYGQLEAINYKVGDTVEAGAVIGKISKVTKYFVIEGAHLYFQVYEGETTLNPMTLLKAE